MFLLETDEKSASPAKSSSSNEEGSVGGGGQRNNTDYIEESVIPGFFNIVIIVKIFHNFEFKHIF